jgi:hypothetical protein
LFVSSNEYARLSGWAISSILSEITIPQLPQIISPYSGSVSTFSLCSGPQLGHLDIVAVDDENGIVISHFGKKTIKNYMLVIDKK